MAGHPTKRRVGTEKSSINRVDGGKSSKYSGLATFDELEPWQRDNEHIHTGYVRESNSMQRVFESLFFLHNETGNIYTHLIPSVVVLCLLLLLTLSNTVPLPFLLFAGGCCACLGLSATFHTLKSHSLRVATLGNKLDYLGICVLIAASMVALVLLAYHDRFWHQLVFISLTLLLGSVCAAVSLMEKFRSREYRPIRAVMFVLYGLTGVLPVLVGCKTFGFREIRERIGLDWLLSEAFLYIFGAFLYAVRFPERTCPGGYDFWGHSHQLFHVCVVIAAFCHFRALLKAYKVASW